MGSYSKSVSIVETCSLIYVHEGNELVEDFLYYSFGISFITEIELLGHQQLAIVQERELKEIISDCLYVDWSEKLKEETIQLRKKYMIKLPDAIIAATSKLYRTPLITADKAFLKIKEIDLVLLDIKMIIRTGSEKKLYECCKV